MCSLSTLPVAITKSVFEHLGIRSQDGNFWFNILLSIYLYGVYQYTINTHHEHDIECHFYLPLSCQNRCTKEGMSKSNEKLLKAKKPESNTGKGTLTV